MAVAVPVVVTVRRLAHCGGLAATADWHAVADRAQRLVYVVALAEKVGPALRLAVAFRYAAATAVGVAAVAAMASDCDQPLRPLAVARHFAKAFDLPVSAGNCDATCHHPVAE